MQDFFKFLDMLWTNEPFMCIIGAILVCMLLQAGISAIALSRRRQTLVDDYGYSEGQIALFFWKSVLLFPLTWMLMIKQGIVSLIRLVRR